MEYRVLGKTGLKVSALGFGGIPIQRIDAQDARELMHQVMEAGINYIDSARGYTVSEEYIGYAIEGIRDQFVLATKSMARDKESMARDVDISLKNFRTDYIDLYQIHNPNASQLETVCAPGGALEALLEARAAGKIGHIGITLHSADVFRQALELDWVETVMFPYNIVETQAEELIAACAEKNIGFICMKPLAGGAIDDATLAMRFISHNSNVTVTIPGMAEKKELDENVAAFCDDTPLTQQEIEKINGIRKELGGNFCRRCGYCAPCSVGIGIPAALVAEGYHLRYNLKDYAMARYEASGAPASSCVDCGLCEERCPYHLPIRQMLKRVVSTFGK
jgi:predicted aldo/keto reductase-like oxidoreductase